MHNRGPETLARYLESEGKDLLSSKRVLFLRGIIVPGLWEKLPKDADYVQTFKPRVDEITARGLQATDTLGSDYDLVLYLPGQHRDENLFNFARGFNALRSGGSFVACMENDLGAGRFEKRLGELGGSVTAWSKNHCRVFWTVRSAAADTSLLHEWMKLGDIQSIEGGFQSCPGIFGWDGVDSGSALLVKHVPKNLKGEGADLGAGFGFLSAAVLEHSPWLRALHLYEAEGRALECAKLNIAPFTAKSQVKITYNWHDVTSGLLHHNLDWIIMNPPFHQGKETVLSLGFRFVEVAAKALRQNGTLYFVANEHLPYEEILRKAFFSHEVLARENGFKVYKAST